MITQIPYYVTFTMTRADLLPLSIPSEFSDVDDFVESLLSFITSTELFQKLCGGVHILDFLTGKPDLYSTVLPEEWRIWFHSRDVSDILDLLMREPISSIESMRENLNSPTSLDQHHCDVAWRRGPVPPIALLDYILSIRKHALGRKFARAEKSIIDGISNSLPKHVSVGMKPKKVHEVENFAKYINNLIADVDKSRSCKITHVIDFGSGQNYLGRALASPPSSKNVIALESKQHNISGAKTMDVTAKLAEKEKILRNKKQYRQGLPKDERQVSITRDPVFCASVLPPKATTSDEPRVSSGANGSIHYIETLINDGNLSNVVARIKSTSNAQANARTPDPWLMVVSLHSCGNLVHHGLRSLVLNPAVRVVAMVGCCYNLVTERLGPPTYKLPSLRSFNHRLDQISSASDPHGFPMSEKLASYQHYNSHGIRLNITARMMAVQAPENWTAAECESFFTRHFYRALLQRILLDRGVVGKPTNCDAQERNDQERAGPEPALTIGSLRKACYASFVAYVRGAIVKLAQDPQRGTQISELMNDLTEEEIVLYEERYRAKKKELSILWSLMAFSASVVESTIVTDRWLWLREQEEISDCWVETVFDYKQSPRNLVVVGIKK